MDLVASQGHFRNGYAKSGVKLMRREGFRRNSGSVIGETGKKNKGATTAPHIF